MTHSRWVFLTSTGGGGKFPTFCLISEQFKPQEGMLGCTKISPILKKKSILFTKKLLLILYLLFYQLHTFMLNLSSSLNFLNKSI
jgi:hypothetical protein